MIRLTELAVTNFKKSWTFSGRVNRDEYLLVVALFSFALFGVGIVSEFLLGLFSDHMQLADLIDNVRAAVASILFYPITATSVRRLHDIGRSGWWMLLAVTVVGIPVLALWLLRETSPEGDRFN